MRKLLVVLSFAAGVGLACNQSATAAPANPAALKEAAIGAYRCRRHSMPSATPAMASSNAIVSS